MHAEFLRQNRPICVPNLVLITQAVFLLERWHRDRQTDRQTPTHKITDATDHPIPCIAYGCRGISLHSVLRVSDPLNGDQYQRDPKRHIIQWLRMMHWSHEPWSRIAGWLAVAYRTGTVSTVVLTGQSTRAKFAVDIPDNRPLIPNSFSLPSGQAVNWECVEN